MDTEFSLVSLGTVKIHFKMCFYSKLFYFISQNLKTNWMLSLLNYMLNEENIQHNITPLDSGKNMDISISKALQIPRTTIRNWITSDFKLTRQDGSWGPCKTSLRDKRQILRLAVFDPTIWAKDIASSLDLNISRTTVGRILLEGGFKSFKKRYKIKLSKLQKKKRLNLALGRAIWRKLAWEKNVFSDEASVRLMSKNGRLKVWLLNGSQMSDNLTLPKCQFGGGSLSIWACNMDWRT